MENYDWYYQVWKHEGYGRGVSIVGAFRTEHLAKMCAQDYNAMAEEEAEHAEPPSRFYFVRPILAGNLRKAEKERLQEGEQKSLKCFMARYRGELLPYAQAMVEAMPDTIKEEMSDRSHFLLHEEGGWHTGYEAPFGEDYLVRFTAVYSGRKDLYLQVTFVRGKERISAFVEKFQDEKHLLEWLRDKKEEAVQKCEDRLISLRCNPEMFDDIPIS